MIYVCAFLSFYCTALWFELPCGVFSKWIKDFVFARWQHHSRWCAVVVWDSWSLRVTAADAMRMLSPDANHCVRVSTRQ